MISKGKAEMKLYGITKDLLSESNPLDFLEFPFVEFLCLPSIGTDFLLQFAWNRTELTWYKTIWDKQKDSALLNTAVEFLMDDEDPGKLDLSFIRTTGILPVSEAKHIITKIDQLSIKPSIKQEYYSRGRSGYEIKLKIGSDGNTMCMEWITSNTPEQWSPLDQLIVILIEFSKTLNGKAFD